MSPSGIETICVNAEAMRFAVMSPNHKVIKEQTCEQSCTFSTADECFIMEVSESPVTAFPPALRKLGGDSAMTLVIVAAVPPVGVTYVLIDLASNGFMIIFRYTVGTHESRKRQRLSSADYWIPSQMAFSTVVNGCQWGQSLHPIKWSERRVR